MGARNLLGARPGRTGDPAVGGQYSPTGIGSGGLAAAGLATTSRARPCAPEDLAECYPIWFKTRPERTLEAPAPGGAGTLVARDYSVQPELGLTKLQGEYHGPNF